MDVFRRRQRPEVSAIRTSMPTANPISCMRGQGASVWAKPDPANPTGPMDRHDHL